jgi:hypothetical protein
VVSLVVLVPLAAVILWKIPRLGLTVMNVIVFVPGALLGMIGFTRLTLFGIEKLLGHIAFETATATPAVPFLISVVGAALGGASFVALKVSVVNKLEEESPDLKTRQSGRK